MTEHQMYGHADAQRTEAFRYEVALHLQRQTQALEGIRNILWWLMAIIIISLIGQVFVAAAAAA